MAGTQLAFFIVAFGFVSAALVNYICGALGNSEGGFRISFDTVSQGIGGFFVCMLAGPYLTLESGLHFWREGQLSTAILCVAALISVLWAFCSGIFIVQFLVLVGLV